METHEEFEHNGLRVRIIRDEDPMDPEDCDNPIYLVHFHRDFEQCSKDLPFNKSGFEEFLTGPDPDDYDNDEEGERELADAREEWKAERDEWIVFLVDSYIHSGVHLTLSGSLEAMRLPDRRWDVSQCGAVLIKREGWGSTMDDEGYSYERDGVTHKTTWRELAEGHVNTWNQYLSGDVWGYIVDKPVKCDHCGNVEHEELDSCWGFYGLEYAIQEAKEAAGCE